MMNNHQDPGSIPGFLQLKPPVICRMKIAGGFV